MKSELSSETKENNNFFFGGGDFMIVMIDGAFAYFKQGIQL